MKLYLKYIRIHIKSLLQYRASFALLCFGQFFAPFLSFAGLYLLFHRFGTIAGHSFYEVAMCYAVTFLSYSLTEIIMRGFDSFAGLIRSASFDRLLLRPQNLAVQVICSRFELPRIGKFMQGLVVLVIAVAGADIAWTPLKVLMLAEMILSGMIVFSAIFIAVATISFWTIEGIELANILTDGGRDASQYPLDIYRSGFRWFFTFIVPLGMANYVPLQYIMGTSEYGAWTLFAPLYGLLFLVPCVGFWYFGVRHYKSAGS